MPSREVTGPSWLTRALNRTARVLGANRIWRDDSQARRATRAAAAPTATLPRRPRLPRGMSLRETTHSGWPVWTITPPGRPGTENPSPPDKNIVYFHGGAYVSQIFIVQWRWAINLARRTGASVTVPLYPLAPRGTAATAVPIAADIVAGLIASLGSNAVAVAGDSAGGGLALAAVQELVRRRVPLPHHLLLMSPWLDVSIDDPESATIDDPLLAPVGLRAAGRLWAGDLDPSDPRVSPLHGALAGLPPTVVHAGTADLLWPDARRFAERAREHGVEVDLVVREGLPHTWSIFSWLPEARAERARTEAVLSNRPT